MHRDDQSLEPLYFESPFEIVLPPDFDDNLEDPNLVLIPHAIRIEQPPWYFKVIRCSFQDKTAIGTQGTTKSKVTKITLIGVPSGGYKTVGPLLVPQECHENRKVPRFEICRQ